MSLNKKATRIFALALCLCMALAVAAPALAAGIVGYTTVTANNTPVYGDSACTTVIGTFKAGDIVAVESQLSSAGVWIVRQNGTGTATGYLKKTASSAVGGKKSSDVVAAMTPSSGTSTGGTDTGSTGGSSTGGQAGYITNCKSNVNFRSAPNSSSSKSSISKNAVVTVFELTNGFYKVTNSSGQTGYVAKEYIAIGTPPASGSSSGGSSASSGTGTVSNCKSSVNWRATASTSGKKLGTLKKGAKVQVLGTEGDFYKITYNNKTGYIAKQYLTVSGGGSSGGASSILYDKVKVEPEKSAPGSTLKSGYDNARRANKDTIGYMSITGTNIRQPILYRSGDPQATYYDSHDANGASAAKGAVHSFYGVRTRNNTVTAHNMRGSNDMFHQLSHIYDKAAGKTTCQTTDGTGCKSPSLSSIPDVRTSGTARQWDIYAFGYTKWEVWAMYKTEADESTATINYNISFLSTASEADITAWINTQKTKSLISGSADANDIFLTLYTCGTNFDHATAQSRIYIFLKAIK